MAHTDADAQPPNRAAIAQLEGLSPFELRESLIALGEAHQKHTDKMMLNAGRGNPNFLAAAPREAFFQLGLFAALESRNAGHWGADLVAQPASDGIAQRFTSWLRDQDGQPGIALLCELTVWVAQQGWALDDVVDEFVQAILGAHYPDPPAMLQYCEHIVSRYLGSIMGPGFAAPDALDLFATEGGTAAMCYVFDTLAENALLRPGDKVAVLAPIFSPYLDIVALPKYHYDTVLIQADTTFSDGTHSWQFSDHELDALRDPAIKLLVCVNPSNPPSVRLTDAVVDRISEIVETDNPGLMIITDDVYATFVDGFRSLASAASRNTLLIYSFSKYFGATGWRLGVIAANSHNIFDEKLAALGAADQQRLHARYASLTDDASTLSFMQRLVADSRQVALRHTAGLSQPQQVQMALFALFDVLDTQRVYRSETQRLITQRLTDLFAGMQVALHPDPLRAGYYVEIDVLAYMKRHYPESFVAYLQKSYEPADILFRLAEQTGVIALNGSGFDGPVWSIRISLANLNDASYRLIGEAIRTVAAQYLAEWKSASLSE